MTNDIQKHTEHDIVDRSLDPVSPIASQSLFWRARYLAESPCLTALPLLFWLTENTRPAIGVTLGIGDAVPHFALCQAVEKLGLEAMCFGVAAPGETAHDLAATEDYNEAHYGDFSLLMQPDQGQIPEILDDAKIDFLIVNRPVTQSLQDELDSIWLPQMSDRGVILFLRGGEGLRAYAADVAGSHGQFNFDAQKGIFLVLCGERHGDRLSRLCQLKIGKPGYLAVRNVFARIGELHSKTYELGVRDAHARGQDPAQIQILEAKLSQSTDSCRQLAGQLESRTDELARLQSALETARQAPGPSVTEYPTRMEQSISAPHASLDPNANDIDDLPARLHKSEQALELRFEDIAILGAELKKLSSELEETRTRATSQTRALEDATRAAQGKDHDLTLLRDILHEAERDRDEARQRVMDLEGSSSWRITSPLRRASLMVRRGRDDG